MRAARAHDPGKQQAKSEKSSKQWYRQVAGAALAAGAAVTAGADDASAGIVVHTSEETFGADVGPGWGHLQTLYFDFFSGETQLSPLLETWVETSQGEGHGVPTTQMLPEGFQFGLAQVGPIDALFALSPQGVQADKYQAMVNTAKSGWTNPDNGIYYSWTLLKPMKLGAGEVIGDGPAFMPAPARDGSTGLNMQTMAAAGAWNSPTPGYLGLKFSPNDGTDYYYGWAEVSVNVDSTTTLHRFAYNDELNQPIEAGDTGDIGPIPGDTNGDGIVDLDDLNNVRNNFGSTGEGVVGDTNGDNLVDLEDLNAVRNNFGAGNPVPEPSSMALLIAGAAGVEAYRRRRSRTRSNS